MALIDVIDVILSPEFWNDGLVCRRGKQSVDDNGIAATERTDISFGGVVTTHNGDMLYRIAVGEHIVGNITVITPLILTDGSDGHTADIVVWNGTPYTVTVVKNWQHAGRGFCIATCEIISLGGRANG